MMWQTSLFDDAKALLLTRGSILRAFDSPARVQRMQRFALPFLARYARRHGFGWPTCLKLSPEDIRMIPDNVLVLVVYSLFGPPSKHTSELLGLLLIANQ